jgi:hypothetical protein
LPPLDAEIHGCCCCCCCRHLPRLYDYLWVAEDGMKMQVGLLYICCDEVLALPGFRSARVQQCQESCISVMSSS